MPDWFNAAAPAVGIVVGFVTAQFGGSLEHRRQRAASVLQRREEFELTHLVEVNTLLRAYVDAMYAYTSVVYDARDSRRSEAPMVGRVPGGAKEALDAASAALLAEIGLILDAGIRDEMTGMRNFVNSVAETVEAMDDDPMFDLLEENLERTYALVAERVRGIYAGRR
ncbi:hypothetical protein [Streptomyces synnematoformans]